MVYYTWNSCKGLEKLARSHFTDLEAAKSHATPEGGPNRITSSDGQEWIRGAYADRAPQWFGPYDADALPFEPNRPGDAERDYRGAEHLEEL